VKSYPPGYHVFNILKDGKDPEFVFKDFEKYPSWIRELTARDDSLDVSQQLIDG